VLKYIDLNADMGEGMATDAAIFPFISSANIACGAHAGDDDTMRRTIELALQHNVAIGAHPSYPDRLNFGRLDLHLPPEELSAILTEQLVRLQNNCASFGARIRHVKPHGALYNRAAKDPAVSAIICKTILDLDPSLLLYGLSGSRMKDQAAAAGLTFVSEVFADRTYREDGSLTPRTEPGALIEDASAAARQVLQLLHSPISADTICIHGDGPNAVEFVRTIHETLLLHNIKIANTF
jgi:UPF0271 protein